MSATKNCVFFAVLIWIVVSNDAAKILGFFPTPSISHQVTFRPITHELARRGHEVVVVTTDPVYPKGKAPANLTEIDVHDVSYKTWERLVRTSTGKANDLYKQLRVYLDEMLVVFERQIMDQEVQKILKEGEFDLLLYEECIRPALALSHHFKVPAIAVSSFGSLLDDYGVMGSPTHWLYYPNILHQKTYNLTMWEKITEAYHIYRIKSTINEHEEVENKALEKILGADIPSITELFNNVHLILLNTHSIWDHNRPLPPNIINIGGIHTIKSKHLPEDIKTYLDSSPQGVIYVSFGTNSDPKLFPEAIIQNFVKTFSRLPYNVLWKFDGQLSEHSKNIKTAKWFPQPDLLRHPNVKLFITQGGLQSTDEAILAGVPLIGMPLLGDQWYNTENYVRLQIGKKLNIQSFTEDELYTAVTKIIDDGSFRNNVLHLRSVIQDQPQSALERAVWWTEHVIRHKGARHLRAAAANVTWRQYYEIELIVYVLVSLALIFVALLAIVCKTVSLVRGKSTKSEKVKNN